jgi:hypothetical protein
VTGTVVARGVDRMTAIRSTATDIKTLKCVAFVPRRSSERAAMQRAKAVCAFIALDHPNIKVTTAITRSLIHAHVLVLVQK